MHASIDRAANDVPDVVALDVALTPAFVPSDPARRARSVYIVVDVVRATTTLSVMFDRGCARVFVAPGIAEARAAAAATAAPNDGPYLLGGESGGVAPPGFNFGNSPREYGAAQLAGRELVFATTNGTRALRACSGGFAIFAGSFRNAGAVAEAAVEAALRARERLSEAEAGSETGEGIEAALVGTSAATGGASEAVVRGDREESAGIVVVCAGRKDEPAYDDTLCAGYLILRLREAATTRGLATSIDEGGRIAAAVWGDQQQRGRSLREAMAECDAGHAVRAVGLEEDLVWCADIDASNAVPYVASVDAARNLLEVLPLGGANA